MTTTWAKASSDGHDDVNGEDDGNDDGNEDGNDDANDDDSRTKDDDDDDDRNGDDEDDENESYSRRLQRPGRVFLSASSHYETIFFHWNQPSSLLF